MFVVCIEINETTNDYQINVLDEGYWQLKLCMCAHTCK